MRNRFSSGVMALFGIGLYYAWRNRTQIQSYLDESGIDLSTIRNRLPGSVRPIVDRFTSGGNSDVGLNTGVSGNVSSGNVSTGPRKSA